MEAIDCPEDLRIRFDKVEREKERKKIPVRSMFFFAKSEMQKIVNKKAYHSSQYCGAKVYWAAKT